MKRASRALVLACAGWLASCSSSTQPFGRFDTSIDGPGDAVLDGTDGVGPDVPDGGDVPVECEDSDGDGVCDEFDVCAGFDDTLDEDGDTVPDGCDVCPGGDDRVDTDGDTLPDFCDCEGITCDVNATCFNLPEGPTCVCNDGFEGDGFTCTDIDECTLGTHTCDVNATCTNTEGSYTCTCNPGYSGDGHTCTDIDECATGAHACHTYATCINTDGGYDCVCNTGYTGDGFTCTPIDHCSAGTHTCSPYATCTFTGPGTYTCACNPGYTGDGFTCTPIDHCAAGTHTCSPYATCTYTGPGTYACSCNPGYSGDGFTCTPIDHCSAGTDLCSPYATCTYTGPGTYTCACNPGYTGDGFTCTPTSGGTGHMIVIGHDYFASNTSADDIVGNAVFQFTSGHVDMLAYTQYADLSREKPNTDTAIEQRRVELGRTLTRTDMSNYTLLGSGTYDLLRYDVLLIYEQETGTTAIMDTIAAAWDTDLDAFLAAGGVIVVSDGYCGGWGGGGSRILYTAGLLDTTSAGVISSGTLTVVDSTDPVATGVPSTYSATNSTNYYNTPTSWNVVVQDASGRPIVMHSGSGSGGPKSILFVADYQSDTNIPTVLTGEGHTVTTVLNDYAAGNATLLGSLSGYDAVYWSATGNGVGATHSSTVITNLESYVSAGGWVFVTGYDSIASPTDSTLIGFVGGTGSRDYPGACGAVSSTASSLNAGVVDIRSVTPTGGYSDRDALTGLTGVTVVAYTSGSTTEAQWTIRTLGAGQIAYVSNGQSGISAHASWTNTTSGGAGAYNAALRNFAFNAP